jgi:hypothetical protein
MAKKLESPEEHGKGHPKVKRGSAAPFDSGFGEGEHGRGPSPYHLSHSSHPQGHSADAHLAVKGRGGTGAIGKGDGFKARTEDVSHPKTHAEFENLGTGK